MVFKDTYARRYREIFGDSDVAQSPPNLRSKFDEIYVSELLPNATRDIMGTYISTKYYKVLKQYWSAEGIALYITAALHTLLINEGRHAR